MTHKRPVLVRRSFGPRKKNHNRTAVTTVFLGFDLFIGLSSLTLSISVGKVPELLLLMMMVMMMMMLMMMMMMMMMTMMMMMMMMMCNAVCCLRCDF